MEREVRLNSPEGLKNNPIKLEAERMMREDGLIKDVPVSDNREVENNFDTLAKYPRLKDGILSITKLTRDNIVKSLKGMSDDQIDEVLTQLYDTSKISGFNLLPSIKTVKGDSEFDIILKPLRDNFDEFRKEMSKIKINDLKNILTELGGVNYVGRENTKYEKNAIITSILKTALNKNDTTYTEQPDNFETMPENKPEPAVPSNKGIQLDEKHFDEKGQSEWIQDRRFYQKAVNNVAKNFSNATFKLDEVSPYGAKVIVTIDGKDQELTKSKVARADFKRLFGKSLEEMQTVESKPEPVKLNKEEINDIIEDTTILAENENMQELKRYIETTSSEGKKGKELEIHNIEMDVFKKEYAKRMNNLASEAKEIANSQGIKNPNIYYSRNRRPVEIWSTNIFQADREDYGAFHYTRDPLSEKDIKSYELIPVTNIKSPAKSPDLKANFESWKEERKTAAPAFKLEQEDITSKEKNTRFNDAQGGLFGKKPVTHESYAKKDLKPTLSLEGNETITSLVTAVKSALMREGLDTKAREFVDKAFKEKDISSLKKLASEYVKLQSVDDVY